MPRLKRRAYGLSGLTAKQRDGLLQRGMIGVLVWANPRHAFHDGQHMRACWQNNRDSLLALWVKDHPLTRPRVWWICDAPEPRRRIDGGTHPFDDPAYLAVAPDLAMTEGVPRYDMSEAFYESVASYLRRLDLLLPGEDEP